MNWTYRGDDDDDDDDDDDNVEGFSGSQADLEGAAENLFSSPPRPNHYILKCYH